MPRPRRVREKMNRFQSHDLDLHLADRRKELVHPRKRLLLAVGARNLGVRELRAHGVAFVLARLELNFERPDPLGRGTDLRFEFLELGLGRGERGAGLGEVERRKGGGGGRVSGERVGGAIEFILQTDVFLRGCVELRGQPGDLDQRLPRGSATLSELEA